MLTSRLSHQFVVAFIAGATFLTSAQAEPISLSESLGDRVLDTVADVAINGNIRTHAAAGETAERPIVATARFEFFERDQNGLESSIGTRRSVRRYTKAVANTNVDNFATSSSLPAALQNIVVEGRTDGPVRFSLDGLMTREAVDLLDMPGDPIVLASLLPTRGLEINETYDVERWAAQMLCSLDVVTESSLTGQLRSANAEAAYLLIEGEVEGARLGAPTKLKVTGTLTFDRRANYVSHAKVTYSEDAEIGTISPGLKAKTEVTVKRRPSTTEIAVDKVPVAVPESALKLYYDAPSWGLRMLHDRDWHVFYASMSGAKPVVILRLLDNGRLLSQMNLAKIPSAAPGEHASLEQFEQDIRRSLGDRFSSIVDRTQADRGDGVKVFRVVATGQFDYQQGDETKTRPMQWTYYLIAHPDGRQLSAIFAHEPEAAELMTGRDDELISRLQFFAPQVAAAR